MRDVGFLYVLANSAMQEMVKVGKTTRSPAERAAELSAATGLPTPFIVVYEQLFEDCTEAEAFVHTLLASKGFRVSDNREFFSAPVNEVIRAIALAPGAVQGDKMIDAPIDRETDDLITNSLTGDELDTLTLFSGKTNTPWQSVFDEAERYRNGDDETLQDYAEALRLYRKAAKLGSLPAYGQIGRMYENGEGLRADKNKALEYYKEGARRGSCYCYWRMGFLFLGEGIQGGENTKKCFRLFVKRFSELESRNEGFPTQAELSDIAVGCCALITICKKYKYFELRSILDEFFNKISKEIISIAEAMIGVSENEGHLDTVSECKEAIRYIRMLT